MAEEYFVRMLEHNNWANEQIIRACAVLSDEQLDAAPLTATKGTIRETLMHMVASQRGYFALLTLPVDERPRDRPPFDELADSARQTGEDLLALAQDETRLYNPTRLETRDGWHVEPWVVLVQVINHAHEHREQINSMLSALGVTPPELDGWSYGLAAQALVPIAES